jgi:hypothetical protein
MQFLVTWFGGEKSVLLAQCHIIFLTCSKWHVMRLHTTKSKVHRSFGLAYCLNRNGSGVSQRSETSLDLLLHLHISIYFAYSSTLKFETIYSTKTLVNNCQTTRSYITANNAAHSHKYVDHEPTISRVILSSWHTVIFHDTMTCYLVTRQIISGLRIC